MITDLDISLSKIKKINEIEYLKKLKKYNLNDKRVVDDSDSYLIQKYKKDRDNTNYRNEIRLKSLRLENKDKYYKGDEKDFFKIYNQQNKSIFKKKWNRLSYNLKFIKLNEYFKKNKTDDVTKNNILKLLSLKNLKKQVEYDIENGFIINIKLETTNIKKS